MLTAWAGCNMLPGTSTFSESDLIGHWDLKYVDLANGKGDTWTRYAAAKDFLELNPDGSGAYGDPTGVGAGADDVVWSLRGDSLFYHSPKWKAMNGKTEALIVRCDADTLIFEEGGKSRFVYTKRR